MAARPVPILLTDYYEKTDGILIDRDPNDAGLVITAWENSATVQGSVSLILDQPDAEALRDWLNTVYPTD